MWVVDRRLQLILPLFTERDLLAATPKGNAGQTLFVGVVKFVLTSYFTGSRNT